MSLQPLPSLLATTVLSGRGQANESAFANTTADLATGNATAGSVIGVNQSAISVSSPGSVLGTVVAGLSGTAISVAGNADADAGALSGTSLVGVNGSSSTGFVNIGGTGSVQGSLLATLTAAGTSTNGNSDATAGALEAIGIRAGNLSINGDGTIAGISQLTQGATARTTAGSSNADAQVTTLKGLVASGLPAITVDGIGALYGATSLVSSATAVTTGDNAATDTANATQKLTTAIGLDLTGATASSIGGAAEITGQAEVAGSANASATTGNSSAVVGATEIVGIRPSDTASLQGNGASVITASGSGVFTAQAITTSGGAQGNADGRVYGVKGSDGQIAIGASGLLNATALLDATASAITIDSLGNNASANAIGGEAIGIWLGNSAGGLTIGGNSSIIGSADSRLKALASTGTGNANAVLSSPSQLATIGVNGTIVSVSGNSIDFSAGSSLDLSGIASSTTGTARATDSYGFSAIGTNGSNVAVSGNSANQRTSASVTEKLSAVSTTGNAESAIFGSTVQGVNTSNFTVSGSGSLFESTANYSLIQSAQSTSGNQAAIEMPSNGASKVDGLHTSNVTFGSNGSIQTIGTTSASLKSLNTQGNADAFGSFSTTGSTLSENNFLKVGQNGSIAAQASLNGAINAQSTSGPSRAGSIQTDSIVTNGIDASYGNIEVSVAGTGNITGASAVGTLNSPYTISSTSVSGSSDAFLQAPPGGVASTPVARTSGVTGFKPTGGGAPSVGDQTTLSTNRGTLVGTSANYLHFDAISTSGTATAGFDSSDAFNLLQSYGARDTRFVVNDATNSNVTGSTLSAIGSTSKSTSGNTSSRLVIESMGLFGSDTDVAIQAANTTGISQVSLTSLATTVLGSSNASALRNLGLEQNLSGISRYSIGSVGSGSVLASSSANLRSTALSVSGNSEGISTL